MYEAPNATYGKRISKFIIHLSLIIICLKFSNANMPYYDFQ